jgi:hypothetical protein
MEDEAVDYSSPLLDRSQSAHPHADDDLDLEDSRASSNDDDDDGRFEVVFDDDDSIFDYEEDEPVFDDDDTDVGEEEQAVAGPVPDLTPVFRVYPARWAVSFAVCFISMMQGANQR